MRKLKDKLNVQLMVDTTTINQLGNKAEFAGTIAGKKFHATIGPLADAKWSCTLIKAIGKITLPTLSHNHFYDKWFCKLAGVEIVVKFEKAS